MIYRYIALLFIVVLFFVRAGHGEVSHEHGHGEVSHGHGEVSHGHGEVSHGSVDGSGDNLQRLNYYRLDNGLRVILAVNNGLPVVNQTLWYRVGGIDEPLGFSGLAHILEHLMFKGTSTYGSGDFSSMVSDLGGIENATTSPYYTNYYQTISSEHWELLAQLESDRMRNLRFEAGSVATEIDVVYEERLSRVDTVPASLLHERVLRALYQNHPKGVPLIGWGHEILAHKNNLGAIEEFYHRYYTPENAILVLSGDIELERAKQVIAETYGKIPRAKTEFKDSPLIIEPRGRGEIEVSLSHADVSQSLLGLNILVPSLGYHDGLDERIIQRQSDIVPLMIIGDIFNSPDFALYRDLVRSEKLALGLHSYYSPFGRSAGTFSFYLYPSGDMDELQNALKGKLVDIAKGGFDSETISASKLRISDSLLLSYDSLSYYANLAGRAMMSGVSLDEFLSFPDVLESTSAEQINETLLRYFGGGDSGDDFGGVWSRLTPLVADEG